MNTGTMQKPGVLEAGQAGTAVFLRHRGISSACADPHKQWNFETSRLVTLDPVTVRSVEFLASWMSSQATG